MFAGAAGPKRATLRTKVLATDKTFAGRSHRTDHDMNDTGDFLRETETAVPIIRGPGEGKVVGVLRDQSTFKVLSEETGGAYAVLEQKIPPGHGPPLHVHRHKTEIFYVLDGRFEITIGERKVSATAGAIVV